MKALINGTGRPQFLSLQGTLEGVLAMSSRTRTVARPKAGSISKAIFTP